MRNGAIDSVENIRDYEYEAYTGATEIKDNFPKKFQLQPQTIKEQVVGKCVMCAAATIFEARYGIQFSEDWGYGRFRFETETSEGMIASRAISMLKDIGLIPKTLFDVELEMPKIKEAVKKFPEYDEIAKSYPMSGFVKVHSGDTSTGLKKDLQIKDAITKYQLPLFAVSPDGFKGGRHAIAINGWDDEQDKYIIQNSWGESYGDNGVGLLSKDKVSDVWVFLFEPIQLPFEDVKEDDWFFDDVKQCYLSGLIKGKSETIFDPEAPITRAEACAMMNRLMKKVDTSINSLNKLITLKHEHNQLD